MKKWSSKLMLGLAVSVCGWLAPQQAEAVVASVKSTGMAATCIAYPQDSLVIAYNPAGIVDVGDRVDLECTWNRDRGYARIEDNILPGINGKFNAYHTRDFFSPGFGVAKQIDCRQAIGLVVYNRNFSKTTYGTPFPLFGTSDLGSEYLQETISPAWAIYIGAGHSIGISADIMIQRIKINGLEGIATSPANLSAFPNDVSNKGFDYARGFTATLGWKWQINDQFAIGLTYRPKAHMSRFKKYQGFVAQHGRIDVPEKFGAGISWQPTCHWAICFDVEHIHWRGVKALHNPLLPNLFTSKLGLKNGAGFGLRDHTYFRIGTDYQVNDALTIRAGYRYARTPIRRSQTAVNILSDDVTQSYLTCGASYKFECFNTCQEISGFLAYGLGHTVKGRNSIPPGFPPPLGTGFGGGEVDLHEGKTAAGLAWAILF